MSFNCKPCDDLYVKIYEKATGMTNFLMEFNPGRFFNIFRYKDIAQRIIDFTVRRDDIWLISFPRTGSTWCQEMIWLIANNLDFETAKNTLQQLRAPILETSTVLDGYGKLFQEKFTDALEYIDGLPSPRCIKTHIRSPFLPVSLHEVKPKIIYTMRNPKDVCVSYYFHAKDFYGLDIDFESFCELFLNDAVVYGGIFDHYFDFWNRRHESNILVMRYEEMVGDVKGTLKKIAGFLQKHLSEDDILSLEEFVNFRNMKENRGCNAEPLLEFKCGPDFLKEKVNFIRNGKIGDWKNHMSSEMAKKFDEFIEKNTRGTDLCFD